MSKLLDKQQQFTLMLGMLITFAYQRGYKLTVGDAYRDPRCKYGHPRTLHRQRLAMDFNLFKDDQWLNNTEDFMELGEYWESLGGAWGGRWGDGNHFSLSYGGMK